MNPGIAKQRLWYAGLICLTFAVPLCHAAPVQFDGPSLISTAADGADCVYAADMDKDGDIDVLSASWYDNKIAWYENTAGDGKSWNTHVISTKAYYATGVFAADIDGDGDMDVVSSSWLDDKVAWYENEDGKGEKWQEHLVTRKANGANAVWAADIDGDGDQDILCASEQDKRITWYENTLNTSEKKGKGWVAHTITRQAGGACSVCVADIDGDGHPDVVSGSRKDDKAAWYRNKKGKGTSWAKRTITTMAAGVAWVAAADMDGDGDTDVLTASRDDDRISWYENVDKGVSWYPHIVTSWADYALSVSPADLDGDGDMDVVSASKFDNKVAWYENLDGKGNDWRAYEIDSKAKEAASVFCADLDGDKRVDVLSAAMHGDTIAWYRNVGTLITSPRPLTHDGSHYDNVLFDKGKAVPKPESLAGIEKVAEALKRHPKDTVVAEGHANDSKDEAANLRLGERRAEAVKRYLVEHGIEQSRITVKSFGSSLPSAPDNTPANRKLNRRVVLDVAAGD
jgi:outer membrane protein OmpA-like peptidoglycan-associated protein